MSGIEQIKQKVKKHGLPRVIALSGKERALVDDALNYLRSLTQIHEHDLNHHKWQAGEDSLSEVVQTLNTMPFLGAMRLVEIHQSEKLAADDERAILEYIKNPSPTSMLIIIFSKADKRSKFISSLNDAGLLISCEIEKESDVLQYVDDICRDCNIKMNNNVAQFLAVTLDNDLLAIKLAINKLGLLFEGKEISVDDVEEQIASCADEDVFKLSRSISEGHIERALVAISVLRSKQENAIKFLGVLSWQFRVILHIRHCQDMGMLDGDIRKEVSIFGDRFNWMSQLARKKNIDFHATRLLRLLECDSALKSLNVAKPFNFIEKLVYQSAVGIR